MLIPCRVAVLQGIALVCSLLFPWHEKSLEIKDPMPSLSVYG